MRTQVLCPFYHTEQPQTKHFFFRFFLLFFLLSSSSFFAKRAIQGTKQSQENLATYKTHPQHKTELNRLQNAIKRKIYHYRQQSWEDNLSTLNAEDNSLWGIAKAFRKKPSPISAPRLPTGIAQRYKQKLK
ncbi:uncharacterized protein TNCV_4091161 [Trichonephila clavipes]|uniref:Uncharacterized protein n=1 Tax=Trichonephila clavipes TaxID=2585209 RepID=A0A8X6USM2_TRICX|nr:uncharacterized protein TNCV_4091161 [Trichonephila clavipes]